VRIAVDSWTLASRFRCQGTYVYAHHLLHEFKKIAVADPGISFSLFASNRNGNDAWKIGAEGNFQLSASPLLDYERLWRMGGASFSAVRAGADIMFIPTAATLPLGGMPSVCTIHDVTAITMPSHSAKVVGWQRFLLKSCARFSRALIACSECTKKDIVQFLGVPEERISVVHNGMDHSIFNDAPADPDKLNGLHTHLEIKKPYVVHHGTIQPRKNLKRLIEAYRLMLARDRNLDLDLVLAGQLGWQFEDIVELSQNTTGCRGRVILAGILPDSDLALLIKGASLAVFPSLYEGFCIPMVEAMACGVPTIAAKTSCLPEISGNALAYFDPLSTEEMAECMQSVLLDTEKNSQLWQNGVARAREFSWERCARETLRVLVNAGKDGKRP
jgi:glycosyltransferase involved in cell wall biosynthesis